MSIHRIHGAGAAVSLLLAGGAVACGGTHAASKPPATAAAAPSTPPVTGPSRTPSAPRGRGQVSPHGEAHDQSGAGGRQDQQGDAELVVDRAVVSRCPTLRLVRAHADELDPDMIWLAVLESIADCMSEGGPMSGQNIGVSGDEEHRHVVREVLGARGVAPTRIVARPTSSEGAAECQGGAGCAQRVEITIVQP
jgi:hypothetical protein